MLQFQEAGDALTSLAQDVIVSVRQEIRHEFCSNNGPRNLLQRGLGGR
ncbi:MAG: hypothetical protein OJF47_000702 [Nitrospira sp.]|nr:MAG: hypothetical protein OJF47_000702 [Nitrospira sp.]